jgi:hypothetical protein
MENVDQIIRTANILEEVDYMIRRNASDHDNVMALILMDYCNETIIKQIHYYMLGSQGDYIADCWKNIDKELKNNKQNVLPLKKEIIDIIHKKRNFIQHTGEVLSNEDAIRYSAYTKSFIKVVSKEILGVDFNNISYADIVDNSSYRFLIEKAYEYKDTNFIVAGALISCALSYADGVIRDDHSNVDGNLGWRISDLLEKCNVRLKKDFEKVFSDIGSRIDNHSKIFESFIKDGCNPPLDVLRKLPSGSLSIGQKLFCNIHTPDEITLNDIDQAIVFAARYIHKLEIMGLLPRLDLDQEKGIEI